MVIVEDCTAVLAEPQRVWAVLIDVPRWWGLYYAGAAKYKDFGWSENLVHLGGEAGGQRFGALRGSEVMQTMRVAEWTPPTRLVLATEPWNQDRAQPSLMGANLGSGRFRDFITTIDEVQWTLTLTLSPAEIAGQTRLTARGEFWFPNNPFFNYVMPFMTRGVIRKGTTNFLRKFPELV